MDLKTHPGTLPDDCQEDARMAEGIPYIDRMSLLAESFPTLRGRPGVRPFDPVKLKAQLKEPWITSGSRYAIQFILAVFNQHNPCNVVDAIAAWDDQHRAAFLAWAKKPWWP